MASRRKITQVSNGSRVAVVYKDTEYGEFVVRLPGQPEADYFTGDKGDAVDTAKKMVGLSGLSRRRRRRRGGLGSAPAEHTRLARDQVKSARWWLKYTRQSLAKGECRRALDSLVTAQRMSASATTNRRGMGPKRADFQAASLEKATERFAKVCLVNRGR